MPFSWMRLLASGTQMLNGVVPVMVPFTRFTAPPPTRICFGVMLIESPHCRRPSGGRHLVRDLLTAGRTGGASRRSRRLRRRSACAASTCSLTPSSRLLLSHHSLSECLPLSLVGGGVQLPRIDHHGLSGSEEDLPLDVEGHLQHLRGGGELHQLLELILLLHLVRDAASADLELGVQKLVAVPLVEE